MKKYVPFLIAFLAIVLGIFIWATRVTRVPIARESRLTPPTSPVTENIPLPPVLPTAKFDPSRGRLVVRVETAEGRPIAGVRLYCNFMGPASKSTEADSEPVKVGEILGIPKGCGFLGNPVTGPDGTASFEIALPPGDDYPSAPIDILMDLPEAVVKRENSKTIPAVKPGETREVTLKLELGTRIRGILRGIDPEDYDDFFVSLEGIPKPGVVPIDEEASTGKKHWVTLPKVQPDGSFMSGPVPSISLLLTVNHLSGKFAKVFQELHPPFDRQVEVPLQRNLDYLELATLNISIANPPPGQDFSHTLVLFAEDTKEMDNRGGMITKEPVREKVHPGRYEAFVMAEKESLWGHASFTAPVKTVTNVVLTLEKAAIVPLQVRERATGAYPSVSRSTFTVSYKIDGTYYELFTPSQVNKEEKIAKTGQLTFPNFPPGEVRLTFETRGKGSYKKWTQDMVLLAGQNTPVEVLLERAP